MKIQFIRTLCVAIAATVSFNAIANDISYKPAMFGFDADQLVSKLGDNSLQLSGGSAVLYCQSEVNVKGVAKRTHCYDKSQNGDLITAAQNAISGLAFEPAQVDGQVVPVRMSYRVGLSLSGEKIDVVLIPNLGSMQDRYGRDYIAPQERLDVSDWYERYNKNSWVNGEVFLGNGDMSRVAATVDEDGKTDIVRTLDPERAYKRDADIVKNALKKSRFIPGFVDGEPVPMGYLAVVNYGGNSGEAVSKR